METTIRGVKRWVQGGPTEGFIDENNKPITSVPEINWEQVEDIRLDDVKDITMDYSGPEIAGLETINFKAPVTCKIDEGEYKDMKNLRIGYMECSRAQEIIEEIKGLIKGKAEALDSPEMRNQIAKLIEKCGCNQQKI